MSRLMGDALRDEPAIVSEQEAEDGRIEYGQLSRVAIGCVVGITGLSRQLTEAGKPSLQVQDPG
jgi:hypothetical protein